MSWDDAWGIRANIDTFLRMMHDLVDSEFNRVSNGRASVSRSGVFTNMSLGGSPSSKSKERLKLLLTNFNRKYLDYRRVARLPDSTFTNARDMRSLAANPPSAPHSAPVLTMRAALVHNINVGWDGVRVQSSAPVSEYDLTASSPTQLDFPLLGDTVPYSLGVNGWFNLLLLWDFRHNLSMIESVRGLVSGQIALRRRNGVPRPRGVSIQDQPLRWQFVFAWWDREHRSGNPLYGASPRESYSGFIQTPIAQSRYLVRLDAPSIDTTFTSVVIPTLIARFGRLIDESKQTPTRDNPIRFTGFHFIRTIYNNPSGQNLGRDLANLTLSALSSALSAQHESFDDVLEPEQFDQSNSNHRGLPPAEIPFLAFVFRVGYRFYIPPPQVYSTGLSTRWGYSFDVDVGANVELLRSATSLSKLAKAVKPGVGVVVYIGKLTNLTDLSSRKMVFIGIGPSVGIEISFSAIDDLLGVGGSANREGQLGELARLDWGAGGSIGANPSSPDSELTTIELVTFDDFDGAFGILPTASGGIRLVGGELGFLFLPLISGAMFNLSSFEFLTPEGDVGGASAGLYFGFLNILDED